MATIFLFLQSKHKSVPDFIVDEMGVFHRNGSIFAAPEFLGSETPSPSTGLAFSDVEEAQFSLQARFASKRVSEEVGSIDQLFSTYHGGCYRRNMQLAQGCDPALSLCLVLYWRLKE